MKSARVQYLQYLHISTRIYTARRRGLTRVVYTAIAGRAGGDEVSRRTINTTSFRLGRELWHWRAGGPQGSPNGERVLGWPSGPALGRTIWGSSRRHRAARPPTSTRWLLRQRRRRRRPGSPLGGGGGAGERAGARAGGSRGRAGLAAGRAPAGSWPRGSGRRRRPGTCRDGGVAARTRPEPLGADRRAGDCGGLRIRRVAGRGRQAQAVRDSARAPAAAAGAWRRRALWVRSHGQTRAGLLPRLRESPG